MSEEGRRDREEERKKGQVGLKVIEGD